MEEMSDKLLCIWSKVEWDPYDQMINLIENKNTNVKPLLWDTWGWPGWTPASFEAHSPPLSNKLTFDILKIIKIDNW